MHALARERPASPRVPQTADILRATFGYRTALKEARGVPYSEQNRCGVRSGDIPQQSGDVIGSASETRECLSVSASAVAAIDFEFEYQLAHVCDPLQQYGGILALAGLVVVMVLFRIVWFLSRERDRAARR